MHALRLSPALVLLVALQALHTATLASASPFLPASAAAVQDDEAEIEALIRLEREEADLQRRRGRLRGALRTLDEHLDEEPTDAASRTLRALARRDEARYGAALEDAGRALSDARASGASRALIAQCARNLAEILFVLGRYDEAVAALEPDGGEDPFLVPSEDPRDAWILGRALRATGDLEGARRLFEAGRTTEPSDWRGLLAKGHCEHALGRLELASSSFVAADRMAKEADGVEPDVVAALADLYFESEREVEAPGKRSAGRLYNEALDIHPTHERALLGLFALNRYNRRRQSRSPEEILGQLLSVRPDSVDGQLAAAEADLQDGQLVSARKRFGRLEELAPGRRELRTLLAALAWVEHRRDDCRSILDELGGTAAGDSRPEREVGHVLVELYRFAESLPFLRAAVEIDPTDYEAWTLLGGALANTGDEDAAREAFDRAKKAARGRQDAWRNNLTLVLRKMSRDHVEEDFGELTFSWRPDAAEVLRRYFVPYYEQAREELSERYGHTPGPTKIEVFRDFRDFSVRSVGFEGFPALGVCFGPVVTAVSPVSQLRGGFSWARTGFHEFSHVIHLGLSHNRCPRWITEGLATWEEIQRNPTWTRNMRRDLIDARANDNLIPVRELNRAFRGPRILFGYYQGGLLCEMLIDEHGFPPMIRLLEAFDRGLDLDAAMREVFGTTPEAIDTAFDAFVDERIAGLAIEPRWHPRRVARLTLRLTPEPPADEEARKEWAESWTTVAWGRWQQGRALDAEQALRKVELAEVSVLRALFLRGGMALENKDPELAMELWKEAIDAGGRDYNALLGLGSLLSMAGENEAAERYYKLAEEAFPGYDSAEFSAERELVDLYAARGDDDAAMRARERWLAWNAGVFDERLDVAAWHVENDRYAEAARLYGEANEVDPFRRDLHRAWGDSLRATGALEDALREYQVARIVPADLDLDHVRVVAGALPPGMQLESLPTPQRAQMLMQISADQKEFVSLSGAEHAELLALGATCLKELGREEESRAAVKEALELDGDCELALELW
ncbi:MAG: tetratricopeptide repeat protein [bacterium]|nr:tetratricopeptide repeat protein [bacterium]